MKLCTIGFSKKSLKTFIGLLKEANVKKVIDIRLHNTSQLAGFAKKEDLEYILSLVGIEYEHCPQMAPTEEIFEAYKKKKMGKEEFEKRYLALIKERGVEKVLREGKLFSDINCLLCSEHEEDHCHRKLLAEYLKEHDPSIEIEHIK